MKELILIYKLKVLFYNKRN